MKFIILNILSFCVVRLLQKPWHIYYIFLHGVIYYIHLCFMEFYNFIIDCILFKKTLSFMFDDLYTFNLTFFIVLHWKPKMGINDVLNYHYYHNYSTRVKMWILCEFFFLNVHSWIGGSIFPASNTKFKKTSFQFKTTKETLKWQTNAIRSAKKGI